MKYHSPFTYKNNHSNLVQPTLDFLLVVETIMDGLFSLCWLETACDIILPWGSIIFDFDKMLVTATLKVS